MFDWLKKDKKPSNVVPFPESKLTPVPEPQPEEHYRVGFTTDDETTLTLLAPSGMSTTLTMKMLRATYTDEE